MIQSKITGVYHVMNTVLSLLRAVLRWLGVLFGLIPRAGRLPPYVYSLIHYAIIIAITATLAWYSPRLIPEARVPISNWFVQRYYVAIQFVLFYLFVRMLIAGVRLFLARDVSEFEDIDRAWDAGLEALAREGYDLQWLPIFVVNGATAAQRKSLFESARLPWKVQGIDDPRLGAVTFHACDEGLFICLNSVGAMASQLEKPALSRIASGNPRGTNVAQATLRPGQIQAAAEQTRRPDQLQSALAGQTLAPGAIAAAASSTIAPPPAGRYGETIRPGEIAAAVSAPSGARQAPLEKLSQEEQRLSRRRLLYFCERLVAERGSYCPMNGLLQLIPLQWTQNAMFEPLQAAVAQDLQTLHDGLHLQFPVVCLHSGLEDITGLTQFLERGRVLDSRFRDSRAGSRYPAGLPIDEKSSTWVVERSLQWFRDWVYAEFAKNLASPQNRQLYQFFCSLSERRGRLARQMRAAVGELKLLQPVRLSGCYFAGTGPEANRQSFVHGVLQRLMSEQNDVAWMPEWRSRNRRCVALTVLLALMSFAILAADVFLAWRIWEQAALAAAG